MHKPGEVVPLKGGGELTVVPTSDGGAFLQVHRYGVAFSFFLSQEGVGELRGALGGVVMARLA